MFKEKCNHFLDEITFMRTEAISQAVNEAILTEHTPFENDLNATKEAVIEEERKKTEEQIQKLQAELAQKISDVSNATASRISLHRQQVVATATEKAKAAYDTFILGVSKLVDSTDII